MEYGDLKLEADSAMRLGTSHDIHQWTDAGRNPGKSVGQRHRANSVAGYTDNSHLSFESRK